MAQGHPNQVISIHLSLTFCKPVTYGEGGVAPRGWVCYDRGMVDKTKELLLAALAVQGLAPTARILLIVLIVTGDDTDAGRVTVCSRGNLAAVMGVTRRTVRRTAQSLERAGLLARSRRTRQDGGDIPSAYTVLTDRLESR